MVTTVRRPGSVALRYLAAISSSSAGGDDDDVVIGGTVCGIPTTTTTTHDDDVLSPGRASKSSKHTTKTAAESLSSSATIATVSPPDLQQQSHLMNHRRINPRRQWGGGGSQQQQQQQQQPSDLDVSHDNLTTPGSLRERELHSGTETPDTAAIFVHAYDDDHDDMIHDNLSQTSPGRTSGWKRRKPSRILLFQQPQSYPELDGFSSSIESSQKSLENHPQQPSFPRFDHAVEKGLDLLLDRSWVNCSATTAANTSTSSTGVANAKKLSPWARNRNHPSSSKINGNDNMRQSYAMEQQPQQQQQRSTEPMYNHGNNYGGKATPNRRWSRPIRTSELLQQQQQQHTWPQTTANDRIQQRGHGDGNMYDAIDIARSDTTGASTEVATNRAVDIALKRIQAMEEHVKDVKEMLAQSITALALQDEQHAADPDSFDLAMRAKSILSVSSHDESTNPSGKLGRHVEKRSPTRHNHAKYGQLLSDTSTLSKSSVGVVEVDPYNRPKRTLKTVINSQRSRAIQPSVASVPEEHESEFGLERPRTMHGTANNYPGPVQKRTFRVAPKHPATQSFMDTTVDSCRSPPIIQRRSYSQEEPSPDPVFCSKSLSAYSSSHISPDSVAGSFESEDAMFMETHIAGDDSSSSLQSPGSAPSHLSSQWKSSTSGQVAHAQLATQPRPHVGNGWGGSGSGGGAYPEKDRERNDYNFSGPRSRHDENHSRDHELEAIDMHDRPVPARGLHPRDSVSTGQEEFIDKMLTPTVTTPPPPPPVLPSLPTKEFLSATQPPNTIVLSSNAMSVDRSLENNRTVRKVLGAAPPHDYSLSSGQACASNRMWEPARNGGGGMRQSGPLALKLARDETLDNEAEDGDIDERSIDVQSIRSVFESLASPVQVDYDHDDSDDDTASVKSLRERFESSTNPEPENGIDKIRCLFEKKRQPLSKKFESGNIELNEAFAKFEAQSKTRKRAMRKESVVPVVSNDPAGTVKRAQEVLISEQVDDRITKTDKPTCIADRIRALNNNFTSPPNDKVKRDQSWRNDLQKNFRRSNAAGVSSDSNKTTTFHSEKKQLSKESLPLSQKDFSHGQISHPAWMMHRERILTRTFSKKILTTQEDTASTKHDTFSDNDIPSLLQSENGDVQMIAIEVSNNISHIAAEESTMHTQTQENSPQESKGEQHNCETVNRVRYDFERGNLAYPLKASGENRFDAEKIINNESKKGNTQMGKGTLRVTATGDAATIGENGFIGNVSSCSQPVPEDSVHSTEINSTSDTAPKPLSLGSTEQNTAGKDDPRCASPRGKHSNVPFNVNQDEENDELMDSFVMPTQIDRTSEQTLEPQPVSSSETMESVPSFKNASENARDVANGFSTDNPIVIKPVARKFFVKPVPIKPVVPSVSMTHFHRNLSISTGYAVRNTASSDNDEPAVLGIRDRTVLEHQAKLTNQGARNAVGGSLGRSIAAPDATVLPRLVAGILEPLKNSQTPLPSGESEHSDGDESEYSDGVTLDMSIAEVSNLTIPTALISKTGERSHASDDGRRTTGPVSVDDDRSGARSIDLIEAEAKKSEASSSQTSEAAAPLIAKALRYLSDDKSTDTGSLFFRSRAQIASNTSDWDNGLRPTRKLSSQLAAVTPDEEKKSAEDEFLLKDKDFGWDMEQVESLFPVKDKTTANENIFDFDSHWQAFPSDTRQSGVVDPFFDLPPPMDDVLLHPSRSKTPTRRNTSRRGRMVPSAPVQASSESAMYAADMIVDPPKTHRVTSAPIHNFLNEDLIHHPLPPTSYASSHANAHVSNTSSKSIRASHNSLTALPTSSTNTTLYGPKHAALLARLRSLKEHRLRRAAMLHNASFSPLTEQDEEASCSTKSSTGFGGSTFQASLVLD
jgi:hypothetical protein